MVTVKIERPLIVIEVIRVLHDQAELRDVLLMQADRAVGCSPAVAAVEPAVDDAKAGDGVGDHLDFLCIEWGKRAGIVLLLKVDGLDPVLDCCGSLGKLVGCPDVVAGRKIPAAVKALPGGDLGACEGDASLA